MELRRWGSGLLPLDDVVRDAAGADLAEGGGGGGDGAKWAGAVRGWGEAGGAGDGVQGAGEWIKVACERRRGCCRSHEGSSEAWRQSPAGFQSRRAVAGREVDEPEMKIGAWAGSRPGREWSWAQEVSDKAGTNANSISSTGLHDPP
jgi:hypothetical protein